MIDDISEIIYDEDEQQPDEYAGLSCLQRRRIEHFEEIGKPWLADAIRTSNGLQPKHPEPKRKTSNFDDIRVDDNTRFYDDFKITGAPGCSVEKAMRCLEKINTDKFI